MLFFEINFLLIFAYFFILYALAPAKHKNTLILIASYIFYGTWDWRFLSLLWISTYVDYSVAKKMDYGNSRLSRKQLLWISMLVNLGMLGVFKYFDFFIESFFLVFSVSNSVDQYLLNWILPAGISFYTFQTMSYTIDVYKKQIPAEKNLINFATFVAFFPQLIAGPIERAGNLLTQINNSPKLSASNFFIGCRLFLFGAFKKVVIADNLAKLVDPVFADPAQQHPLTLLFAAYCFGYQIYCDFSGYTDMARGLGKMMGFNLSINFNLPYMAKNMRDFWKRWHITLYDWLRDYVYIPLGGNKLSRSRTIRNILIVFTLSGVWHGAGWNFILWGAIHGIILSLEIILSKKIPHSVSNAIPGWLKIAITFHLVTFTWIIFRCQDMSTLHSYMTTMFSLTLSDLVFSMDLIEFERGTMLLPALGHSIVPIHYMVVMAILILPLMLCQSLQYRLNNDAIDMRWPVDLRLFFYSLILMSIIFLGSNETKQFIYFQF